MANITITDFDPLPYLLKGVNFEAGTFASLAAETYPKGLVLGRVASSNKWSPFDATPQVETWTAAGTETDGTYSLIVDGHVVPIVRSTTPATNADIGAALRAAWAADDFAVSIATVTGSGADVILTKTSPGQFVAESAAPAPGTLDSVTTTAGAVPGADTPSAVLSQEIVAAGVADFPVQVLIQGETRDAKTLVWTGGSPVIMSDAQRDALRDNGIVSIRSTELSDFDNS